MSVWLTGTSLSSTRTNFQLILEEFGRVEPASRSGPVALGFPELWSEPSRRRPLAANTAFPHCGNHHAAMVQHSLLEYLGLGGRETLWPRRRTVCVWIIVDVGVLAIAGIARGWFSANPGNH